VTEERLAASAGQLAREREPGRLWSCGDVPNAGRWTAHRLECLAMCTRRGKSYRRDGWYGAGGVSSIGSPTLPATKCAPLPPPTWVGQTLVASAGGVLAERITLGSGLAPQFILVV